MTAFEALKLALCTAPVFARPDFSKPFTFQCDACEVALSAVLTQEDDNGDEHPILYLSRTLYMHDMSYTVSEKKLSAVVWSIEKLRPYLEGYHFFCDNGSQRLEMVKELERSDGTVDEMLHENSKMGLRKGLLHHVRNALSHVYEEEIRRHVRGDNTCMLFEASKGSAKLAQEVRRMARQKWLPIRCAFLQYRHLRNQGIAILSEILQLIHISKNMIRNLKYLNKIFLKHSLHMYTLNVPIRVPV